jgi:hypothetical protein
LKISEYFGDIGVGGRWKFNTKMDLFKIMERTVSTEAGSCRKRNEILFP